MENKGAGSDWKANIDKAPAFVRFSLLGVNSRGAAMGFVVASVLAAIGCLIWGEAWIAVLFALAAVAYYYSMNWVDKNG